MFTPTPIHPLFPYTTLFRSARSGGVEDAELHPESHAFRHHQQLGSVVPGCFEDVDPKYQGRSQLQQHRDRKSTRLNSSHRCISYAVFCLKKKNISHIIYITS